MHQLMIIPNGAPAFTYDRERPLFPQLLEFREATRAWLDAPVGETKKRLILDFEEMLAPATALKAQQEADVRNEERQRVRDRQARLAGPADTTFVNGGDASAVSARAPSFEQTVLPGPAELMPALTMALDRT